MKIKLLIAVLAAAILPMTAQAGENYVGINAGGTTTTIESDESVFDSDQSSTATKIYYGHRFTPMWGIETGASFVRKSRVFDDVPESNANFKTRSMYVAATGTFPASSKFAFTAKVGATHNTIKLTTLEIDGGDAFSYQTESESKTSLLVGVGVIWNITNKFSLVAEAENYGKVFKEEGASAKMTMVSVGARFAF
jgi:OOP family OmpA-OmpF porin